MMDNEPPAYSASVEMTEREGDPALQTEYAEVNTEAAPPTYQATTNEPPAYSNDPPPAYDSLIIGKVQKIKDESDGNADFAKRLFCMACCGTTCIIISIIISFVVPLASLIIGSIYLKDCPIERYIPIFLIVSGVFGILKAIGSFIQLIVQRNKEPQEGEDQNDVKKNTNPFDGIVGCFLLAWLIAGSVWVYRVHKTYQSVDPLTDDYCNKTLYLFAFWLLTVSYILTALMICCGCGCAGLACFVASGKGKQPQDGSA